MQLSKDELFAFFIDHPERPWHVQDLQKRFELEDRTGLNKILGMLVNEGLLIRTRRRTYGLPNEMNIKPGRLQVTSGGYGFVILDEGGKDIFVPAKNLGTAWDGDRIMVRPNSSQGDNGRPSGEVVRIIERRHNRIGGTLEYGRGHAILRPDSPRLGDRILLVPDSVGHLEAGTRLVARMIWPEDSGELDPFGELEEVLGRGDDPEIETRAVIIKFDLKDVFDPDTISEASAVPPKVTGEMMTGRTDYRHLNTFTIDGKDAKDFDDAISVERLSGRSRDGLVRIGVHIADVSHYVAEGTTLDREARERATSVYLPGRVLPMLPEQLSNGICSLVEGESRLALSALIDLTRGGQVKRVRFRETVIVSDARLDYQQVQEFADGGRLPRGKQKLERDVRLLIKLTQSIREARQSEGALDFDLAEAKVDVDEEGSLDLTPIRSNIARQIVEELMLLANRLVAKELSERDVPTLYRVHEDPNPEKVQMLGKALGRLGYEIDPKQLESQDLQKVIAEASGKPEAQLVNILMLRSLKRARYSAENLGHYGLAFTDYLHFTSPIRRYPDLVVHRVLKASLQHRLSPTLKERLRADFPGLAEISSQREKLAEEAERDLTRYYHSKWASERCGEVFEGVISGVNNFGLFVALRNAVEGLVHISNLDDDYYLFLEDALTLLGRNTKKRYRLGDRIEVTIAQANPITRHIDLLPGRTAVPEAILSNTKIIGGPKGLSKKPFSQQSLAQVEVPLRNRDPVADNSEAQGVKSPKHLKKILVFGNKNIRR